MKLAELKLLEQDLSDRLADDIIHNWMDKDENELFTFLKKNIDSNWMSYLQKLSDEELEDVIDQAYYKAQNN